MSEAIIIPWLCARADGSPEGSLRGYTSIHWGDWILPSKNRMNTLRPSTSELVTLSLLFLERQALHLVLLLEQVVLPLEHLVLLLEL